MYPLILEEEEDGDSWVRRGPTIWRPMARDKKGKNNGNDQNTAFDGLIETSLTTREGAVQV